MNRPDHFSASQLTTFLNCPLAYRFRYIDGIETGVKPSNLVLGSAFHSAAEHLHKHLMDGRVQSSPECSVNWHLRSLCPSALFLVRAGERSP